MTNESLSGEQADDSIEPPALEHSHRKEDINQRLSAPIPSSYLRDAVYGAIDGAVTTFAVVSGVSGAGLSANVVIILGIANLVGDGFSMAAGNFLGTRAEHQRGDRLKAIEHKHIRMCPSGEKEEVRQILQRQGYEGELLEATVEHITADEETWVNTMLQFEYGLSGNRTSPLVAALATFSSFLVIGFLPLLPFVIQWLLGWGTQPFAVSTGMTAAAFLAVGAFKSTFVEQHWFSAAMETLLVGGIAAGLAYLCGYLLSGLGLT